MMVGSIYQIHSVRMSPIMGPGSHSVSKLERASVVTGRELAGNKYVFKLMN